MRPGQKRHGAFCFGATMILTETQYWRDAVAMAAVDRISHVQLFDCVLLARTGEQFNAAVWATIRLNDLVAYADFPFRT